MYKMKGSANKFQKMLSKSNSSSRPSQTSSNKKTIYQRLINPRSNSKSKSKQLNNKSNDINTKIANTNKKHSSTLYKTPKKLNKISNNNEKKVALTQPNDTLKYKFENSISKVFNVLDIFSKGSIGQANISRWVPEAALYFLGSVFQKIRNNRLTLNQYQFHEQCSKIFKISSQNDIKQFIDNISMHPNFNQEKFSYEGQNKQTIQSQVEDKFSFPFGETSFRKINPAQKTMPVKEMKFYENNLNSQIIEDKKQSKQPIQSKAKILSLSPLNNLNQFENVAARDKPRRFLQNDSSLNFIQNRENVKDTRFQCQSPFFKGNNPNLVSKPANRRNVRQSEDRIDKLSIRLQDYIKQNAIRLERSKNTRIEI